MSQIQSLKFLLDHDSRKGIRTLILFVYFVIFQSLILFQKPFLQLEFAIMFYSVFSVLFLHHFLFHLKPQLNENSNFRLYSYFVDFIFMILFMRSFQQLSSFFLVLQLSMLFVASFDLSLISLCALGFIASVGTSLMNLSSYQMGSMQSLLSLTLFNLSYLSVIVIASQLKNEIQALQSDLSFTQKKWKSQAELTKILVENIPLGLVVTQSDNQVIMQNSYFTDHLKLKFENFIHRMDFGSLGKKDFVDLDITTQEEKLYALDKTDFLDQDTKEKISIFLFKDVTDIRKLENDLKQKEKLAAVGQLAAGIAHEIRNPLAGISGSIQLLSKDKVDSDEKKLMSIILKEIDRLNNLITEFLDYAKPEKRPDQYVDLKFHIEDVVNQLKLHPDVPKALVWDLQLSTQKILGFSEKIKQALLNILINSIQASKDSAQPTIRIILSADNDFVTLSIKDSGVGMSDENLQKMFEPFHTTKTKGTGLGLAITHKILESHSAKINVNSALNKGTTFTIKFPRMGQNKEELL